MKQKGQDKKTKNKNRNKQYVPSHPNVVHKTAEKLNVKCWTLLTLSGQHLFQVGGANKLAKMATQAAEEAVMVTTVPIAAVIPTCFP